jgi:hypothetical protein
MDTITATPVRAGSDETHYQCWYPVCLGSEIGAETLAGVAILGTRVIAYRDPAGRRKRRTWPCLSTPCSA